MLKCALYSSQSTIQVYNSLFPEFGSSPIFNGTLSNDMKIGNNSRDFIKSQSGIYHLGVMYQGGLFGKIQVVPVLVVDSISSGIYDTVIPDLSTSWQDYTQDNSNSTQIPDYDFDFTDETPIVLGSGTPSVESYYNALNNKLSLLPIKSIFRGSKSLL
mgnify:CR=1 FL=1